MKTDRSDMLHESREKLVPLRWYWHINASPKWNREKRNASEKAEEEKEIDVVRFNASART